MSRPMSGTRSETMSWTMSWPERDAVANFGLQGNKIADGSSEAGFVGLAVFQSMVIAARADPAQAPRCRRAVLRAPRGKQPSTQKRIKVFRPVTSGHEPAPPRA